ncbi:unnamed protein product [Sphagnum troendelagicum]|uniref:Major facilitator superfamily (MFS) profile domain-containing protein n=1 Tax=Sphagnum troendelagicum TaxID=128251 RepID=A0ABP0U4B3_9BRYO
MAVAGGNLVVAGGGEFNNFEGRTTSYLVFICLLIASCGLMFGYDIGINGGVAEMNSFLEKFFPTVVVNKRREAELGEGSLYCQYNNQNLQAYNSALYLAAFVSTWFSSYVSRHYGRKGSILVAGISFLMGVILRASAQNLAMLVIGQSLLGWGLGFSNQAAPLYLSEMAPFKWRGSLNYLFGLGVTVGAFCANLINYGTAKMGRNGWRVSLGLGAVPAILITIAGIALSDTPNSLIQRGKQEEGKAVLRRIRGVENVDVEFEDILIAGNHESREGIAAFKDVFKGKSLPPLIVSCLFQIFNQFTGSNDLSFYAPVLFSTLGFKSDGALYSAVILAGTTILATLFGLFLVDRLGRRALLMLGNLQMFISLIALALILRFGLQDGVHLPHSLSIVVVVFLCAFLMGWSWSWAPLAYLIPTEIFPLETRSAGLSIQASVNFLFSFVMIETFLSMLCSLKWGFFIFFAAWIIILQSFVMFYLPETKGVPIEETELVWTRHWFWKKFIPVDKDCDKP